MRRAVIGNFSVRARRVGGFTLIEALVGISLMAFVASVVLLATETTVQTSVDSAEQTIAEGMARQLLDEALGKRYMSSGLSAYQYPLGPSYWEKSGNGRERFDDVDDYHGFVAQAAEDRWGNPLGQGDDTGGLRHANFQAPPGFFDNWRQQIEVYYVDADDLSTRLSAYQTSPFRAIEVTILKQDVNGVLHTLTSQRRVYSYVPPPP